MVSLENERLIRADDDGLSLTMAKNRIMQGGLRCTSSDFQHFFSNLLWIKRAFPVQYVSRS